MEQDNSKDKELSTNYKERLKVIVSSLPESPGIYQYYDDTDTIIYVGKAKNLKRRVASYFNKEQKSNKTKVLVRRIRNLKYIVVNSEKDALLLENNLIKQHKPRYNVLLKDDKTYPSICVQNEFFPRVFKTRHLIKNGSTYFGPYTPLPAMYNLLDLVRKLYPIRTCNLNLSPEKINEKKYKVCLEYHIKKCAGPCMGYQSQEEYLENISEVKEILKGNTRDITNKLKTLMAQSAENLEFEKAQSYKEKIELLENYTSKSEIVSNVINNIDVFSIESNENKSAYINFIHTLNGSLNQAYTLE